MHSDEYRRLYAACLTMAEQSHSPDARARWLALAKDCENLLRGSSNERRSKTCGQLLIWALPDKRSVMTSRSNSS
jgi:hypothetical protein